MSFVPVILALASAAPMQGKPAAPAQGAPKKDAPKQEAPKKDEPKPEAPKAEGETEWIADFDEGAKAAKAAGKDLLVDFTGSDWCGWCIKLHDEVFKHDEFLDGTDPNFVRVALDYPHNPPAIAKVPNPKRNAELAQKYHIRGYPTVLLMTADGEVYGRTGYQPDGPEAYVKSLDTMRENGKKQLAEIQAFAKSVDAAKGADLDKLLDQAIEKLNDEAKKEDSAFVDANATIVRKAYVADPNNEKGLKLKAFNALIDSGAGETSDFAIGRELDPKNQQGILEKVVEAQLGSLSSREQIPDAIKWIEDLDAAGPIHDQERAKRFYANAAVWSAQVTKDNTKAKKFAQKAKDLGVSDNPQLAAMLDKILSS